MRLLWKCLLAVGVLWSMTYPQAADASVISSTFSSGLEGWTGTGGTVSWSSTGGNPGGFLQQVDTGPFSPPIGMYVSAPAAFLGNLSAYIGGVLSFDSILLSATATNWPFFGLLTIRSGASSVSADFAAPGQPPMTWTTYSGTLDAATFGTTTANFATIMGNVTAIELVLESNFGVVETMGLDNFSAISAVPVPPSLVLFGLGGLTILGYGWVRRLRPAK